MSVSDRLSLLLQADEFLETVVHLLDGLVLGETHTTFVRNVVDTTFGFGVFTSGTAHLIQNQPMMMMGVFHLFLMTVTIVYLQVVLSSGFFQFGAVGSQFGQLDVDGSADGGAQVGRAESQETETVVVRERNPLFDVVDGVDKAGVDGLQVTTLLHRDDTQVILFVAPDQESLVDVVVDTTASGPESASVGRLSIENHSHKF